MNHPFTELQPEYERLLAAMVVTREGDVIATARRLLDVNHRPRLEPPCAATGVPLVLWSALCDRESGCRFDRNPAQGDPLTAPSVHVPKGRPPLGAPPNNRFPVSYEYAAEDSIRYDHLNDNSSPWSMAYACFKGELWNGLGPRNHGKHTGYLWAATNIYTGGKYVADGVWDPNAHDEQIGIVPVMLRMIALDPALRLGGPVIAPAATTPIAPPISPPVGLRDASWVQRALNTRGFGPLTVDNSYGRFTRAAVRAYQVARNINPNGLAGPDTLAALAAETGV